MGVALQIDRRLALREHEAKDQQQCTLLELVQAVAEITGNEDEIVATVLHLLGSGQVKLAGNFCGEPVERFTL